MSTNDSVEYLYLADNLFEGVHYAGDLDNELDYRLFSKRPLGFAVMLALSAATSPHITRIINVILALLLYLIGVFIIKEWKGINTPLINIYSINFALCIGLVFTTQLIMADLLLAVIIAIMLYSYLRYRKNYSKPLLNTIGVLWGLALLVKPIMLPSVLIAIFLFVIAKARHKTFGFGLLLPLVIVGLVYYQNYKLTSVAHFSSISAINKVHYNSKLLISNKYGIDSANSFPKQFNFEVPRDRSSFKEYITKADRSTVVVILDHPMDYLKLHLVGMIKSVVDPGRFEIYTLAGENTADESLTELLYSGNFKTVMQRMISAGWILWVFVLALMLNILRVCALGIGVISKDTVSLLLAFVLLYFIGIAGPIGAFRFVLPAIIPYLILSSIGLHRSIVFLKKRTVG